MAGEGTLNYIKRIIAQSGMVGKLIAASTVVFLIFLVIAIVEKLFLGTVVLPNGTEFYARTAEVRSYFAAPGDFGRLLYQPWSLITQMFTHADFGHYLFNMLVLFFSGKIFSQFFGDRRLLSTYILGGIFAYLIHLLAYATLPIYANTAAPGIVGASGSVMAVFIATVVHKPRFIVHLFGVVKVPLVAIGALYMLSTLLKLGSAGNVAHFVHLGGAIFGAISVINVASSKNFMNRIDRFIFQWKLGSFQSKKKPKKKAKTKAYEPTDASTMTDDEYNASKAEKKERIDAILDKISKKGYEGLTKKEKDILFNESKK